MADHLNPTNSQHLINSSPVPATVCPPSSTNSTLENVNAPPIPAPNSPGAQLLQPRVVYLRDHVTHATIYPITSATQLFPSILTTLQDELNREIIRGDTYPMEEEMDFDKFVSYWFGTFAALMLLGRPEEHGDLTAERDWASLVLGTFYIKPNYPGRSSHICNGGFLTTMAARGKGCGKLMGEAYLDFAPKLGFTYSVFNLVYESNITSTKIWDSLGFKRIGSVRGAGRLRSCPNILVDAIIYGRDLKDDDDYVSEERFDKIRFYLEKGKYPPSADRSEKSRLRSAATHYRLINGKLMLKDKEVVSDSQLQYEIARNVHSQSHGGINKTTANIAEKYHWVRIKETVSQVIRNCADCKEHGKVPSVRSEDRTPPKRSSPSKQVSQQLLMEQQTTLQTQIQQLQQHQQISMQASHSISLAQQPTTLMSNNSVPPDMARATAIAVAAGMDIPVDPQMMDGVEHHDVVAQHAQFVQQLQQVAFAAPVAPMHSHLMAEHDIAAQTSRLQQQHAAAVEAARAALNEGGESLTDEDRTLKDRHLLETLTAELKREGYGDDES
ncbi:hypothetical protein BDD12DRAFT_727561 [Trichophaea hybrida]|nr:hypothetical protein BDD12DRAFT_727561 [Trichophaea hybrida]